MDRVEKFIEKLRFNEKVEFRYENVYSFTYYLNDRKLIIRYYGREGYTEVATITNVVEIQFRPEIGAPWDLKIINKPEKQCVEGMVRRVTVKVRTYEGIRGKYVYFGWD